MEMRKLYIQPTTDVIVPQDLMNLSNNSGSDDGDVLSKGDNQWDDEDDDKGDNLWGE